MRRRCTSTYATSGNGAPTAQWRDPGAEEWSDLMVQLAGPAIVR